jgi:AmpD protein
VFAIRNHRLEGARQVASPNHGERPHGQAIDLLVIHNISLPPGQYGQGYIDDLFCNCLDSEAHPCFAEIADLRVSAHLLIDRTGAMTQYVPFDRQAWHAGRSDFCGRQDCNAFSIGIELEGCDHEPFTDEQYSTLMQVTRVLQQQYPDIKNSRITGHSDIAPDRKTDPGPCFDWQRYLGDLGASDEKSL